MPNTATATFPTLTAGRVARASDVESKFDWTEQHLWPHSTGTVVNNLFDIGNSTSAYWRTGWFYSLNATTTAQGIAIGTTTVANTSDVVLEIAGTRAVLFPRLTTAQRNSLTGINGMQIYNSSTQKFNVYENGVWQVMGQAFGFEETQVSAIANVATTITSFTGSGRVLGIFWDNPAVGNVVPVSSMTVDGVGYTLAMTSGTGKFILTEDYNADTTTAFLAQYTSGTLVNAPRPFSFSFQTSFELKVTGNTGSAMAVKALYETA